MLEKEDFPFLKPESIADILSLAKSEGLRGHSPVLPAGTETWEFNEPVDLTSDQVAEFMKGVHPKTEAGLRVFADRGPIIDAHMLNQAGITNYSHFQSTVTKRTRTVTGKPGAYLFGWDSWIWDPNEEYKLIAGKYGVSKLTHHALRGYFGLNP